MSYVLDALRKADAERERGTVPTLLSQPESSIDIDLPPRWRPSPVLLGAMAALGLVAAGGVAWTLMAQAPSAPIRADAPTLASIPTDTPAQAPTQAPIQGEAPGPAPVRPEAPATTVAQAEAPGPRPAPAVAQAQRVRPQPEPAAIETPAPKPPAAAARVERPAPRLAPAAAPPMPGAERAERAAMAAAGRERLRAAPAGVPTAAAAPTAIAAASPAPAPAATEPTPTPTDVAAASATAGTAAAPNRPVALAQLPASVRSELPALTVGGSMYSEEPAARLVILNGQPYRERDVVVPGLTLELIQPRAAILEYRGYRIKLKL